MCHLNFYNRFLYLYLWVFVLCFIIPYGARSGHSEEPAKSNIPPCPPTQAELDAVNRKINPQGLLLKDIVKSDFKIVWCRDFSRSSSLDIPNKTLRLMRYKSGEFSKEEFILPDYADYYSPMFTADGEKIIFSRYTPRVETYIVNFDGGTLQRIAEGLAIGVVYDVNKKQEWLYTAKLEKGSYYIIKAIYRQILNSTNSPELIWDKMPLRYCSIDYQNFINAIILFNVCGYIDLLSEKFIQVADYGKNPAFLPDKPNIFSYLERFSRNICFFDIEAQRKWQVSFDTIKTIGVYGISNVRWSNRYPFFVFTAPYLVNDRTAELDIIARNVPKVYVGELSSDGTKISKAVQLTSSAFPDFFPAMWISSVPTTKK